MPARRTSDAAKQANGTYTRTRHIAQPRYIPKAPKMPEWLSAGAKKVWQRVVPELQAQKILCTVDLDILVLYCVKSAKFRECNGEGFSAAETTQFRMIMAELGLTPATRLRAPPLVEDPEPKSTWQSDEQALQKAEKTGKVTRMSSRLSTISRGLTPVKSTPADTSD